MRRRNDQGAGAVLVLVMVAVIAVVALAGVSIGALLSGQRRAASAADLAALSAARALQTGGVTAAAGADACVVARRISEANGAELSSCRTLGEDVVLEVQVEVRAGFGTTWRVPGRAKAGPERLPGSGDTAEGPTVRP